MNELRMWTFPVQPSLQPRLLFWFIQVNKCGGTFFSCELTANILYSARYLLSVLLLVCAARTHRCVTVTALTH